MNIRGSKRDLFYLILLVLTLVTMIIGITFTYLALVSSEKKDSTRIQTGMLAINYVDGKNIKLTPTEYNILKFLTKNKGKVFSISQIYENVWEEESYGTENIIAVHIRHIREKIEINPREPRYLKVIWGIGYKIENI